jgi:hypothetical protein
MTAFNSALVNSGNISQSSSNGLQNWTKCHTVRQWNIAADSGVLMLFKNCEVSEHFAIPNAIHSSCTGWKVRVTERANTTSMSTVLIMILLSSMRAVRNAWSNIRLSVWLWLTISFWLWPVSRGCLLLHRNCSYLCFCRGSVLPYTRPCICYFGIMFDTLLTSLIAIDN